MTVVLATDTITPSKKIHVRIRYVCLRVYVCVFVNVRWNVRVYNQLLLQQDVRQTRTIEKRVDRGGPFSSELSCVTAREMSAFSVSMSLALLPRSFASMRFQMPKSNGRGLDSLQLASQQWEVLLWQRHNCPCRV